MKLRNPLALRALTRPGPSQLISITHLAQRAEVSPGFIYHLLSGRKQATPEVAKRITVALGESLEESLFEEGVDEQ